MRGIRSTWLTTLVVTTVVGTLGLGATARAGTARPVNRGYQHLLQVEAARDAAMAARGARPGSALPTHGGVAGPATLGTVRDVEQISEDTLHQGEKDTQVEPDIAMDPNNANSVVAVTQQGRFKTGGSADSGFAASSDGGHTWTSGNFPGLSKAVGGPYDRSSDPTAAFGPDHVAYASTIDFTFRDHCPNAVGVNTSTDGGRTWNDPVFPQADHSCDVFNDKNWLAVDTNPASPFFGRVYLVWSRFAPNGAGVLRYSDDDGQTWSSLIAVTSPTADVEGLLPLVQSNGDLTVVYDQFVGGQDLEVAQTSADGGATWSSPSRVNGPDPNGEILDHFTPDVAAYGGVVHVTYRTRDFAGKHPSDFVDERYIVSDDGGATFGGELVLGPPTDLKYAAVITGGRAFLGDYFGVVANADVAHAVWTVAQFEKNSRYHQTMWSGAIEQ